MPAEAIKVAVRVRPFNDREKEMKSPLCVSMAGESTTITSDGQAPKTFTFDYSYWSHDQSSNFATQETVMDEVGSGILSNALNGFHGCLFAYGQTGAGKSYSVVGSPSDPGIIPRSVDEVFRQKGLSESPGGDGEIRVWISFLEIYNEAIHDLLDAAQEQKDFKIMDHPQLGVYIPGLTEAACPTSGNVQKLMDYGTKKRVTACTNMNATSSRSHAVFCIKVQKLFGPPPEEQGKKDERKAWTAKINLVDLAGSERLSKTGAEGSTLKEGCAINQSLSALGMVIKDLSEIHSKPAAKGKGGPTKEAVPFRSSKLTFILKDSLAGNSKTVMMAAISPAGDNSEETISTLRFASSVKKIKTVAKQNIDAKDEAIQNLQAEIKKLRAGLGKKGGAAALGADGLGVDEVQDEISHREQAVADLQKGYEDHLLESEHLQSVREDAMKDQGLSSSEIDEMFGMEKNTPYLVNMSPDPMLTGCLMYFLKQGMTTIGSISENTIVISGLGIPDHLCQIENTDDRDLTILTLPPVADGSGPKGKVRVNGAVVQEQAMPLKHFDKIIFGRACAFRIVIPLGQALLGEGVDGADEATLQNNLHERDMMQMLIPEESEAWGELQLYLEDLWQRLGEDRGRELFGWLSDASHLTDEANEITQEMRLNDRLKFEVELVWDIHREASDIIVIRVMRFQADGADASVMCYWTLAKFKERVEMMRDCYDQFHKKGSWEHSGNSLEDPWLEPDYAELVLQLHNHRENALKKSDAKGAIVGQAIGTSQATGAAAVRLSSASAKSKAVAPKQLDAGAFSFGTRSIGLRPTGMSFVPTRPPLPADDVPVANSATPTEESEVAQVVEPALREHAPPLQGEPKPSGGFEDTLILVLREQLKEKEDNEAKYKERIAALQERFLELERSYGPLRHLAAENLTSYHPPLRLQMQSVYSPVATYAMPQNSVRRISSTSSSREPSPSQSLGFEQWRRPVVQQVIPPGMVLQRGRPVTTSTFAPSTAMTL